MSAQPAEIPWVELASQPVGLPGSDRVGRGRRGDRRPGTRSRASMRQKPTLRDARRACRSARAAARSGRCRARASGRGPGGSACSRTAARSRPRRPRARTGRCRCCRRRSAATRRGRWPGRRRRRSRASSAPGKISSGPLPRLPISFESRSTVPPPRRARSTRFSSWIASVTRSGRQRRGPARGGREVAAIRAIAPAASVAATAAASPILLGALRVHPCAAYRRSTIGCVRWPSSSSPTTAPDALGLRPFHEFDAANETWPRGDRPAAIREAAAEFRARFATPGEPRPRRPHGRHRLRRLPAQVRLRRRRQGRRTPTSTSSTASRWSSSRTSTGGCGRSPTSRPSPRAPRRRPSTRR